MSNQTPKPREAASSYWGSVVGRVNRHRVIAFFVCAPLSVLALRIFGRGEFTAGAALQCVVFAVATYSSATAAVSAWPSKRKQALAGDVPPSPMQVWMFRWLSISCGMLAFGALLGLLISIYGARVHTPQ